MPIEAPAGAAPTLDPQPVDAELRARVLTRIIVGIVHDLRTPLGTMLMKLQLLRDALGSDGAGADSVDGHLRVLEAQVERMTDMLRRIAGAVEPASPLGWVDAGALLADVVSALAYEAKLKTVELALEPRPAAVRASVEPAAVGRLVLALVGRAIGATEQGGRLVARAVTREGSAVVELDRTPAAPDGGFGYDWDHLASAAAALGGRLERAAGERGLERITLTMPGNERT